MFKVARGLLAFLLASCTAFAGGSVMAVGYAQFLNSTGVTANDLHVSLSSGVFQLSQGSSVFSTITPQDALFTQWTLSDGVVSSGSPVDVTWASSAPWTMPQLMSAAWSVDGQQVGGTYYPLYLDLDASTLPNVSVTLVNPRNEFVDYTALTLIASLMGSSNPIIQNGSGRLSPFGQPGDRLSFGPFDPGTGVGYMVQDLTGGAVLQGAVFAPEPLTPCLVGAGLVVFGLARRRAKAKCR